MSARNTTEISEEIASLQNPSISLSGDKSKCHSFLSLDELEKQDNCEIRQQFIDNSQRFSRLIMACGLLLATHSELLCYFLMILNQMQCASLLSLPLPLMVFLWGMLSVPRPSKAFWVTVITYTESVVVCKYLYQFLFIPWNDGTFRDSPFFPPRIIGIEKTSHYASVDIALLIALFVHRSILRKYGLWRDAADDTSANFKNIEPRDTLSDVLKNQDDESSFKEYEDNTSSETEASMSKLRAGLAYIIDPFASFFKQVTKSSYNATTDMYAPMFFCDFILFLVLVFGFSSFGPVETAGDTDVTSYIQDSKIPIPFLIMLITQFIFIIIDRGIFLRKFVLGKFIFQILLVILIHVWMFFVLPAITKRSFFNNFAAQIWYFIKCIYFGLSAHQIRCGYPNRILGNCLTKKYGYTNLILFKGFLAIPFLLELRALMDWIWTDSTLAVGNWLQMEDIYANIFVLKCWREIEKSDAKPRAVKKSPIIKYISGGALLIGIILIIWFPLVFFSFFNAVFISNPPYEASITVSIGGYQPLFTSTALGDRIRPLTEAEFSSLRTHFSKDKRAYSFLSGYEPTDMSLVTFDGKSLSIWGISPVSQTALAEDLKDPAGGKLILSVELKFMREPVNTVSPEHSNYFELNLRRPSKKNEDVAITLSKIISGELNSSVNIYGAFPRFLRLANKNTAIVMDQLLHGEYGIGYSNISLQLQIMEKSAHLSEWWNLNETIRGSSVFSFSGTQQSYSMSKAYVIVISDRKAPKSLSFLSGFAIFRGGVVVMYVSFVLVVFKFFRVSFVSGRILYIHLEEAPDLDYLLQIIDDMYLAREMKDYWLEEEIFAKLIFILRCPDVLFYVTRIRNIVPAVRPNTDHKLSVSQHPKEIHSVSSQSNTSILQPTKSNFKPAS